MDITETKIQSLVAAVVGIINALVLLDWLHLTDTQIAGVTTALVLVMGAVRAWFAPEVNIVGHKSK